MAETNSRHLPPLAVVAGVRTPFAKAFGSLAPARPISSAGSRSRAFWRGADVRPADVGAVVSGNVADPPEASNVARVIVLCSGVPWDRVAHTVNRNCASGMESVFSAWQIFAEGRTDLIVAGGTESLNVPFLWNQRARAFFLDWARKGFWGRLAMLPRVRPNLFKPIVALELGLTDPTCGLNMGRTAEVLAQEFGASAATNRTASP